MLINLDSASTTPLYAQLVASLRRSISTGEVGVGEKLPTAADLADSLDLNRNTVLRAYRELRDDGVVSSAAPGHHRRRRQARPAASPQMEAA